MIRSLPVARVLGGGCLGWFGILLLLSAVSAQTVPDEIRIAVVGGEGVTHGFNERVNQGPVVRVEDTQGRGLEGATVVFSLPTWGPSGEFSNGSKTVTVTTDQDGRAAADGFKTNQTAGKLQIYVTATYRGVRARNSITQLIEPGPNEKVSGGKKKTWIILAIAGAAAAGGIAAATLGGSSSSAPPPAPGRPPIGITAETPTVGPPGP